MIDMEQLRPKVKALRDLMMAETEGPAEAMTIVTIYCALTHHDHMNGSPEEFTETFSRNFELFYRWIEKNFPKDKVKH